MRKVIGNTLLSSNRQPGDMFHGTNSRNDPSGRKEGGAFSRVWRRSEKHSTQEPGGRIVGGHVCRVA
ncbi:uncharacterized protein M421DRAFT_426638 [Didymella exigua CBS 183.55]|uniref:Uncharacterized protein n=1 Tax=Didymella exigua CBS 183.55 TaxID=1150837 RepID=A0A6A5R7L8_9PLEO|nr:uncharacterized protein M421DRAFT_426638 [Didymella exigua CBS 183.55]KAF1922706.1 hypothetical protein M421DRAFT_426638 [Didymella exigua CBS 183.55]